MHEETLPKKLDEVLDILIKSGVSRFISGGAMGFDLLAAELVLQKRHIHPHIKLSMILPCHDQTARWPRAAQLRYRAVLNSADDVSYITEKYDAFCMHLRNRALVDSSDILVCYLVRESSGTGHTKNYAIEKNLKVLNLADLIGGEAI